MKTVYVADYTDADLVAATVAALARLGEPMNPNLAALSRESQRELYAAIQKLRGGRRRMAPGRSPNV